MSSLYITPGQSIGTQTEDAASFAQVVIGAGPATGGKLAVSNIQIGDVAYASLGTNTTDVAGQFWITDLFVPYNRTVTAVNVLQGGTATTDNILAVVYDSFGNFVASSALAGLVLSGANTFRSLSLVLGPGGAAITSARLLGPQRYFVAVQGNGTAAGAIRTVAASTYIDVLGSILAGTFGTIPTSITPPTTFTAGNAPIVFLS
jgi:hypothetical protein